MKLIALSLFTALSTLALAQGEATEAEFINYFSFFSFVLLFFY